MRAVRFWRSAPRRNLAFSFNFQFRTHWGAAPGVRYRGVDSTCRGRFCACGLLRPPRSLSASGWYYFQQAANSETATAPAKNPIPARPSVSAARVSTSSGLIKAMQDRYDGKYVKTMSFLQNNTRYTATGEEQKSQWYEHIEIP